MSSGIYWIDPDRGSRDNAFRVYCDQDTVGGGWTLVWRFTFTNYNNFHSVSNAVVPRPNWPTPEANVRVSTKVPLTDTEYEAMDFNLWKTLGKEFLVKSNINHWITCQEGTGSSVAFRAGSINCRAVKNVAAKCHGVAPSKIEKDTEGIYLRASSFYYDFEATTSKYKTVFDPCGKGKGTNYKRGVSKPYGSIYIR